ncbi:MAG: serine--tRNA ligase, partial [Bacteroidetes bacterium]
MLTINYIIDNQQEIIEKLRIKNFNAKALITDNLLLDKKRRKLKGLIDSKQAEMNNLSKQIGILFKNRQINEANTAKEKTVTLKEEIKTLNSEFLEIEIKLNNKIVLIPNIPHSSVKQGKGEDDNEIIKTIDIKIKATENIPHWELTKKYDIIDFDLGNKLTGAGFPVYKGKGAKLQRALINFFLYEAEKAGYNEIMPPIMVNADSGFGTGQLPDKEGQMYYVEVDNLYLIPTAEVPITNIYRDVILSDNDFPIKHTAYTPCFRREAGSYGKDVRGLNRLHQFDKVEVVQIQHPDKSYET